VGRSRFNVTVNKTFVIGAVGVAAGAGLLWLGYQYAPWQTAAAWAAGDEERAGKLADYAFSLRDYASVFILPIFGGLALMAYAAEATSA
jgi:hypothetical protein